jgi:lipopolysaccharide transport system ATP-binding protein
MYIGEGGSSENQYFDDLSTAPGNDVVRIKSFEILPLNGSSQITIETGILFRLKFMCYMENAMLDANMEVSTMDDMTVFQVGQVLGEVGQKDSKKGVYTVEFKIDPYTLNAGRYKTEIFFGENQRYLVYGGFEQCFEVENSLADMGFNQSVMPGFLRPKNDFKVTFEG